MICHLRTKAIAGFLLLASTSSFGNVFDTYGLGAGSVSLGNATTAGGPTAFAAYSNPALLTRSSGNELSSSVLLTQFHLQDLPEAPGAQLPPDPFRASEAGSIRGGSLGINLKLSDRLHGGLAAYMPQGNFGRIRGLSPYQTSYLRYSEQQQKPAIYTALGYQLTPEISVGLGTYYSLRAKGLLQISLSSRESEGRFDFIMEPVVVPYGGIHWQQENLTLGAFYRKSQETLSEIESNFAFSTDAATLPFDATTSMVPFYDPAMFRVGASYKLPAFELHGSYERAYWSNFKVPVVTISGNDVAALSQELLRDNAGLRDTHSIRLGVAVPTQISFLETGLELRGGLEYHSSANMPSRVSRVADPARSTIAAGAALGVWRTEQGQSLSIEGAYQYNRLSSLHSETPKGSAISLSQGSSIQTFVGGLNYVL